MAKIQKRTGLHNAVALRAALKCDIQPLRDLAVKLTTIVLDGRTLKEAARELGIGVRTIERIIDEQALIHEDQRTKRSNRP